MNWLLPSRQWIGFEGLSDDLLIVRGLGGGSQGQVFEVDYAGERLALKWFFPSTIDRDRSLAIRLSRSIQATSPSDSFLWPLALLRTAARSGGATASGKPSFGYLMPLRKPNFIGLHEHIGGRVEVSFRVILTACHQLVDAFHTLHLKGLCYKDISTGNIFFDPENGDIRICDNDNVDIDCQASCGVRGTPGFMAPEVVLGTATPSSFTDLFSLAVLLFRLLTRHDPFRGKAELEFICLDEQALLTLHGLRPVFLFDPEDASNRPDPRHHPAPLLLWSLYPAALQACFLRTFCAGLREPRERTMTGEWKQAILAALDSRRLCTHCLQENFPSGSGSVGDARCWQCGNSLPSILTLSTPQTSLTATVGNELHRHHLDPMQPDARRSPYGRIVSHPEQPDLIGIENLSEHPWIGQRYNGDTVSIAPGSRCNLRAIHTLHTPLGRLTIH